MGLASSAEPSSVPYDIACMRPGFAWNLLQLIKASVRKEHWNCSMGMDSWSAADLNARRVTQPWEAVGGKPVARIGT